MPVTLIVKAPNQQIGDQTIQCQLNWTVKKLKGYLSEVYPSKPRSDEQKLIYSGHLLHDSSTLKEVLRRYEGQDDGPRTHTLHLVCTALAPLQRSPTPSSINTSSTTRASSVTPEEDLPRVPTVGEQVQESNSNGSQSVDENTNNGNSSDGLRHRLPSSSQGHTGSEVGFSAGGGVFINPWGAWAMQMTEGMEPQVGIGSTSQQHWQMQWMQQAYAQYLAQYMQLIQSGAAPQGFFVPTPFGPGMSTDGAGFNNADGTSVGTPVFPPPANNNNNEPAIQEVAAGGADEVDGMGADGLPGGQGQNRDWIDWIYFGSRLMVLLSIVYFYSTLARFLLVTGIGMAMYLWQVGFFRLQQPPAPNPGRRGAGEEEARANARNDTEEQNRQTAEDTSDPPTVPENEDEVATEREEGSSRHEAMRGEQERTSDGVAETRPTVLALTWTFFTSFFASLIPDTPNAI